MSRILVLMVCSSDLLKAMCVEQEDVMQLFQMLKSSRPRGTKKALRLLSLAAIMYIQYCSNGTLGLTDGGKK